MWCFYGGLVAVVCVWFESWMNVEALENHKKISGWSRVEWAVEEGGGVSLQ